MDASLDDFLQELLAAQASGERDRVLTLVADDAVYWFSNGDAHHGLPAIEAAFVRNAEAIEGDDYRVSDVVWLSRGDTAAALRFRFAWSGRVKGEAVSASGRGTWVLALRDGRWRVVHEHLSRGEA
ncbi:MAG: nuclear transport factor 2 family protein [Planctomycetota bacterium]